MISVYNVLLMGQGFLLNTDEGFVPYGFYRNEYVLATSPEEAAARATKKALNKLQKKDVAFVAERPPQILAEKIESRMPFWRLFRNEGFIFFNDNHDEGANPSPMR